MFFCCWKINAELQFATQRSSNWWSSNWPAVAHAWFTANNRNYLRVSLIIVFARTANCFSTDKTIGQVGCMYQQANAFVKAGNVTNTSPLKQGCWSVVKTQIRLRSSSLHEHGSGFCLRTSLFPKAISVWGFKHRPLPIDQVFCTCCRFCLLESWRLKLNAGRANHAKSAKHSRYPLSRAGLTEREVPGKIVTARPPWRWAELHYVELICSNRKLYHKINIFLQLWHYATTFLS